MSDKKGRYYVVTDSETEQRVLVRADNQARALRAAIADRFDVALASQDELVDMLHNAEANVPIIDAFDVLAHDDEPVQEIIGDKAA